MPNKDTWQSSFVGARYIEGRGVFFRVWAPKLKTVILQLIENPTLDLPLQKDQDGYFQIWIPEAGPGTKYQYLINGRSLRADPVSRYQPEGIDGPSEVVAENFEWEDKDWTGVSLKECVIYELHVGTFTKEGTFDSIVPKLGYLKELGISTIEIMPVAQFPGKRNWGYDGVFPHAVQNTYGGPLALKRFINECHKIGLAVFLDVVYNHVGPEGNYFSNFGKYFQYHYHTPWGEAFNFDGPGSDDVRSFFFQNATQWLDEFHIDGLRLDATHAICDLSPKPFLEELADIKKNIEIKTGRKLHLIAETDSNDSRMLISSTEGGLGLDGQWSDDFHRSLHALITQEKHGYYQDFGTLEKFFESYKNGVYFQGQYSSFKGRKHGRSYNNIDLNRLAVFIQNHDQVGNRANGDRLSLLVDFEKQKFAAACMFLSPFMPLLFMGEEYGETAPFLYFIDHSDKTIIENVTKGRSEEFKRFNWIKTPPDPLSRTTFEQCIINPDQINSENRCKVIFEYYKRLIEISKWIRKENILDKNHINVHLSKSRQIISVSSNKNDVFFNCFFSFNESTQTVEVKTVKKDISVLIDSTMFEINKNADVKNSFEFQSRKITLQPFSVIALRG